MNEVQVQPSSSPTRLTSLIADWLSSTDESKSNHKKKHLNRFMQTCKLLQFTTCYR